MSELAGVMWSNGVNLTEKPRKASQKSNKDATARRDRCPRVGESFIKRRKGKEKKRRKKKEEMMRINGSRWTTRCGTNYMMIKEERKKERKRERKKER